jgi:isopentenyl diphosphate isomerase/L-lactate dehydrogenase-like FMN-dependent dehydrogenase
VERVINILRSEFERTMALTGRRSITEIDGSVLWKHSGTPEQKTLRSPAAGA